MTISIVLTQSGNVGTRLKEQKGDDMKHAIVVSADLIEKKIFPV
jgi:hypothetical protein